MKKLFVGILMVMVMVGCNSGGSSDPPPPETPPPIPIVTEFSGVPLSGIVPLEVSFSDSSTGKIDSWLWNFGDGNTSTLQNPIHTYNQPNQYNVTLVVTGSTGSDTLEKVNYITVDPPLIEAYFIGTPLSGTAPLEVTFNETSTGNIDGWLWDFGDGNTSNERNPVHVYEFVGHQQTIYTVTLTITDSYGSDTMTKVDYITVDDPGYEHFNPDNAVDIAVKIYMNGEEPFDVMDVPVKNSPLFLRHTLAVRNVIKQIDFLDRTGGMDMGTYWSLSGKIYGDSGYMDYILYIYDHNINNEQQIKIWMKFYNYHCGTENVRIPGQLSYNYIYVGGYINSSNGMIIYKSKEGYSRSLQTTGGVNEYSTSRLAEYISDIHINIEHLWKGIPENNIRLKNGIYYQLQITDQYVQWYLYNGFFEINNSNDELSLKGIEGETAFFILNVGNAFASEGCFIVEQHDEMFPNKDSSLKFLIVDSTSFRVFIDTYSDGTYDWDSGIILWSDYYTP